MDTDQVPITHASAVEAELAPGEQLLWIGVGDPKRHARRAWPVFAFGLFFTAFSGFMGVLFLVSPSKSSVDQPQSSNGLAPLLIFAFILVGMGIMTIPTFLKASARRTVYAVTNRRVLLVVLPRTQLGNSRVTSVTPKALKTIECTQRADGSGDIILWWSLPYSSRDEYPQGLIGINRVREVHALIQQTLLSPKS